MTAIRDGKHFRACNLCEAICGLEITVANGAITDLRGDALDPLSHGHICPKGNALIDLHADPDRLKTPLRRAGDALGADRVGRRVRSRRGTSEGGRRGAR